MDGQESRDRSRWLNILELSRVELYLQESIHPAESLLFFGHLRKGKITLKLINNNEFTSQSGYANLVCVWKPL